MNEKKEYVKATSDVFIKYLFGMDTKKSNQLVLSFINAVLQNTGFPAITKVIQKNPYNYKEFVDDKESILDIKIEDENHKLYNVEMQSSGGTHYRNRALYYWSKLYASQIKESVDYETLLPTIGINILNFTLFPELPGYHNFFVITEGKKREYTLTDHLIIHFLEIPKIKGRGISSKITNWLLYLKSEGQDKDMLKILLESDEDLKSAHEVYKAFNEDEMLREHALAREKTKRDNRHKQTMARKEGLAEGELKDKHTILIRLLSLKYTLSEDEKNKILSVTDLKKLDAAIDAFVFAEDKESVLKLL